MELTPGWTPDKDRRTPSPRSKRKLSIPVATGIENAVFKRRFSNVGDAARKLSTTIGWSKSALETPPAEITAVGRALCTLYIRSRLKRAGVFNKKLGLTRVRSAVGSLEGCGEVVRDIFPGLSCACAELEAMQPKLFTRIARQIGRGPDTAVSGVLVAFGEELLKVEPTWGKIIAIYCVAAGLALDSVRQGRMEDLHVIQVDMNELLEDRMALWIHTNGGWQALAAHCKVQQEETSFVEHCAMLAFAVCVLVAMYFLGKFFWAIGT
nr:bcl-2-related ovarian killer protein homolog B-like [Leptinotarsa decemlineata]XP_023015108.1 bcl-2-related ovarian killer protein homolog B-like [Leptinotarsa decemlineata]XP_023015109.1 bcl-2-related ovarian killer protein homolog B-like [Leptinotarsa decemlineata]